MSCLQKAASLSHTIHQINQSRGKAWTKRQGGLLGSSAEHHFLAMWGEIKEVWHQPDLKEVRETRSNKTSF